MAAGEEAGAVIVLHQQGNGRPANTRPASWRIWAGRLANAKRPLIAQHAGGTSRHLRDCCHASLVRILRNETRVLSLMLLAEVILELKQRDASANSTANLYRLG